MSAEHALQISDQARKELGDKLREARRYLGLTQDEVSQKLGIQRTALGDIETGQRRVDAIELSQLAKLYQRPTSHFLGEELDDIELNEEIAHLAKQVKELSDRDRDELSRFAEYLRVRALSENE